MSLMPPDPAPGVPPSTGEGAEEPWAPIFDLQSLSTHDGSGFRTVVFLQGCPLRCTWCCNPEGQASQPSLRWRHHLCCGCLRCVATCPSGAASVELDSRSDGAGAPRPVFDRAICNRCSRFECVDACCEGALEASSRMRSASDVLAVLRRDIRLYRNSGGGVTFSGGEPLVHAAFVRAVAEPLRAQGVSVAVETCGAWNADSPDLRAVLDACDRIFFDIKCLDAETHQAFTRYPLAPIIANLELLAGLPGMSAKIVLSLPLIPGVSDRPAHIDAVAALAGRLGLRRVRLLPYHNLALGKYGAIGLAYPHAAWDGTLPAGFLDQARERLTDQGIEVTH